MKRYVVYDFIKGIAILSVILHHSLTFAGIATTSEIQYTLGHAVPAFLVITILLNYKKYDRNIDAKVNIIRLFKSFVLPFILTQVITISIALKYGLSFNSILKSFGCGAGTYYIILYLQIVFLCKIFFKLCQINWKLCGIVLLAIHLFCEFIFKYLDLPEYIYRLICTRYLFLYFIAYLLFRKDLLYRLRFLLLLCAVIGFVLQYINCEYGNHLGLYPSDAFVSHKFYANFITLIFICLGEKLFPYFKNRFVISCGRMSNYLFLIQLTFFPAGLYLIDMFII